MGKGSWIPGRHSPQFKIAAGQHGFPPESPRFRPREEESYEDIERDLEQRGTRGDSKVHPIKEKERERKH